jgi:hypothetical protein
MLGESPAELLDAPELAVVDPVRRDENEWFVHRILHFEWLGNPGRR